MARPAGTTGEETLEAIREAGTRLIYARGDHAVTMRDLAAAVGIQAPSLYNHVRTKQDLLVDLITGNLQEMLDEVDAVLDGVEGARARLEAFVAFHLGYHTARREKAMICSTELRSLEPEHLRRALAMRDAYERRLGRILADGVAEGVFAVSDERVATMAILSMLTGAANWYRPGGRLGRAAFVAEHVRLALGAVGAR